MKNRFSLQIDEFKAGDIVSSKKYNDDDMKDVVINIIGKELNMEFRETLFIDSKLISIKMFVLKQVTIFKNNYSEISINAFTGDGCYCYLTISKEIE